MTALFWTVVFLVVTTIVLGFVVALVMCMFDFAREDHQ